MGTNKCKITRSEPAAGVPGGSRRPLNKYNNYVLEIRRQKQKDGRVKVGKHGSADQNIGSPEFELS